MSEPVDISLFRSPGRYEITADDAWITGQITSARMWCETYTDMVFVPTNIIHYVDQFSCSGGYWSRCNRQNLNFNNFYSTNNGGIPLSRTPFLNVVSVTYYDTHGTLQTLDPSLYTVIQRSNNIPVLVPSHGNVWPTASTQSGAITVIYCAGYADPTTVPQCVKDAIICIVASWYNDLTMGRGIGSVPEGVKALLSPVMQGGC